MSDVYVRLLLESEQYKRKLQDAEKRLDRFKKRGAGSLATVTPKGLSSLAKGLGGIGAAVGAATTLQDIVRSSMELEKSLSSLGSLTGATAEDLKYFERTAIDLSTSTSQGAAEIVEAFKLIGGQRAELLDSREALVSVTRSAITLAEAAETDVPTAAKALTGALNQMGAGAEAADSYINAMAAGAQAGAGEIDYLMKAIEKSGGTASATGVAFNELVAAGINQTKHQLLLEIVVDVDVLLPWEILSTRVVTEVLVSETVIIGAVPDTYVNMGGTGE